MGGVQKVGKGVQYGLASLSVSGQAPNHNSYDKSGETRYKEMSQKIVTHKVRQKVL